MIKTLVAAAFLASMGAAYGVRTALAKRIIETRGMASVVSPPFRRPNYACQVGAAGALVGEPRGPRLQVALFANKLLIRTAEVQFACEPGLAALRRPDDRP